MGISRTRYPDLRVQVRDGLNRVAAYSSTTSGPGYGERVEDFSRRWTAS